MANRIGTPRVDVSVKIDEKKISAKGKSLINISKGQSEQDKFKQIIDALSNIQVQITDSINGKGAKRSNYYKVQWIKDEIGKLIDRESDIPVIKENLEKLSKDIDDIGEITADNEDKLSKLYDIIDKLIDYLKEKKSDSDGSDKGKILTILDNIFKQGEQIKNVNLKQDQNQGIISKTIDNLKKISNSIQKTQKLGMSMSIDNTLQTNERINRSTSTLSTKIGWVTSGLKKTLSFILSPISTIGGWIWSGIKKISNIVGSVFKICGEMLSEVTSGIWKTLKKLIFTPPGLFIVSMIGGFLYQMFYDKIYLKYLKEPWEKVKLVFNEFINADGSIGDKLSKAIKKVFFPEAGADESVTSLIMKAVWSNAWNWMNNTKLLGNISIANLLVGFAALKLGKTLIRIIKLIKGVSNAIGAILKFFKIPKPSKKIPKPSKTPGKIPDKTTNKKPKKNNKTKNKKPNNKKSNNKTKNKKSSRKTNKSGKTNTKTNKTRKPSKPSVKKPGVRKPGIGGKFGKIAGRGLGILNVVSAVDTTTDAITRATNGDTGGAIAKGTLAAMEGVSGALMMTGVGAPVALAMDAATIAGHMVMDKVDEINEDCKNAEKIMNESAQELEQKRKEFIEKNKGFTQAQRRIAALQSLSLGEIINYDKIYDENIKKIEQLKDEIKNGKKVEKGIFNWSGRQELSMVEKVKKQAEIEKIEQHLRQLSVQSGGILRGTYEWKLQEDNVLMSIRQKFSEKLKIAKNEKLTNNQIQEILEEIKGEIQPNKDVHIDPKEFKQIQDMLNELKKSQDNNIEIIKQSVNNSKTAAQYSAVSAGASIVGAQKKQSILVEIPSTNYHMP